jgi:hypothetical protein
MFDILEEMLEAEGDGDDESEEYNEEEDEEWLRDNSGRDNGYYGNALKTLFEASSKITKTVCKKRSVDAANLKNSNSKEKSNPEKEKNLSNVSSKKDLKKPSKLKEPVADIAGSDSRINSKKSSVKTAASSAKASKRPAVVLEADVSRKIKKIKKIDGEIYNSDSRKSSISSKASNNANSKGSSSIKELHKETSTAKSARRKNFIKSTVVKTSVSESIGMKHPSKSKLKLGKSASAPAAAVRKANSLSSPTRILNKSVKSDQKSKAKEKLTQLKPKTKIKKS